MEKQTLFLIVLIGIKKKKFFSETFIFAEKEDGTKSSITYEEFNKQISKVGNALKINGFQKGDVIALYMPQFIETYIAYFAILKIGCIVLPLFSGYGSNAVSYTHLTLPTICSV